MLQNDLPKAGAADPVPCSPGSRAQPCVEQLCPSSGWCPSIPQIFQAPPCSRGPTCCLQRAGILGGCDPASFLLHLEAEAVFLCFFSPADRRCFTTVSAGSRSSGTTRAITALPGFVLCLQSLQLIPKTRQLFKKHGRDDASHRIAQQAFEPQACKGTLDPSSMQTAATAPNPGKHKAALITAPAAAC